jgi:tetratricopeptide (TPR) repeat protein
MLVVAFLGPRPLLADDAVPTFEAANKLYEQGKYADAITNYQKLLEERQVSAAVYFNLGNACFKSGQTGQAIVYYRLAQRLAPRDPDIRANLRFVRETVGGAPAPGGRWQRWLNLLTLNELTLVTAAVLWVWLLVLAAGEWQRQWLPALRVYRRWGAVLVVLLLAWLGIVADKRLGISSAVVIAKEASVRYGPLEEAQSFYRARDGAEFEILDRKDGWLQVQDASKRVGWMQAKDVLVLPRG